MDYTTFLYRISLSFLLSLLVGIERQVRGRAIGLRTSVLVSVGTFMFVSFSINLMVPDMSRIASQVVSGIGFLGAGVIIKDGANIKGLNTAATLWCNAAIGVLCAGGLITEAAIGTAFILFSNVVLRYILKKIHEKTKKFEILDDYSLTLEGSRKDLSKEKINEILDKLIAREEVSITGIELERINSDVTRANIDFKVNANNLNVADSVINEIDDNKGLIYTSIVKTNQEKVEKLDDDEI